MWRWIHSLPRAVRNHFHSPGASAGVSVEDKYDVGTQRCETQCKPRQGSWRIHCKYSSKRGKEQEGQQDTKAEKIDWNQIDGKHSPIEAFGWGGAIAIGIQLTQLHSLHKEYRRRDGSKRNCILHRVVYALPGISTQPSVKKSVLQTDKKRHEDNSNEDIFQFTLHSIEQELLQELARKTQDPASRSADTGSTVEASQCTSPVDRPEWTKIILPTNSDSSRVQDTVIHKIPSSISMIKNLGKDLFGSQTEDKCTFHNNSESDRTAGEKFNILDIAQQVKRRQSLSDTIHWLPNGFSLPQPTFQRKVLHQYGSSRTQQKTTIETKDTCEQTDNIQKLHKTTEFESLEEVFEDFTNICKEYTATGKNMMGLQEARIGNMKCAVELWEDSSMLGNAKALYNLGICYETGKGVEKDLQQAVKYYTLASEANHPQAIYNLGLVYLEGSGVVPKDEKLGLEMLHQAGDQGLLEAQRCLGVFYTNEAQENWERAVYYFKLAAKQKDRDSQYYLGLCYEEGCGVQENTCIAANYYKLAAEQGHEEAQYRLALFHLHGLGGLPVNMRNGTELLHAAAEQGHIEARTDLHTLQGKQELKTGTGENNHEYTPLLRSVSFPTIKELVNTSFSPLQELSPGCLSQLVTEFLLPGYGTVTSPAERTEEVQDDESDSGVIFTLGYTDTELGTDNFTSADNNDVNGWMGNICRTPLGTRRSYTMPDLHVVSCF